MNSIKRLSGNFLSAVVFTCACSTVSAAPVLLGQWDLDGSGKLSSVYSNGGIEVVSASGVKKQYSLGNVAWSLWGAKDTNGKPGAELLVKAGPDVAIIDHKLKVIRKIPVGNRVWSIIAAADTDNNGANEVILSLGTGIGVATDVRLSLKEYALSYTNSWSLVAAEDLSGQGADAVLNMGNGPLIINLRNGQNRRHTFSGYSAIFGVVDTDGAPGAEIIGRTTDKVYFIKGGVSGSLRYFNASTTDAWAIYGNSVDTDGVAGAEIILVMQGKVRIIHTVSGNSKDYKIGTGAQNYSIDSATDIDGQPGVELQVRTVDGKVWVISDRLGQIYPLK
ncbi:Uncharacterised protein [Stutzerimonas stutzeri]|uniref:hypothetical protein n=1 Tax=Stutzerimonas stutzeri subgroup TaxID=578833 RepID=UPI000C6C892E|nr:MULTISPECIES: hypothetical protein [Stutzerimonas stutzeri subgroup]MCQ2048834.1 hypothetical protein [Stutzerimonas kunmingensis]PKR26556.1 hypothetical protein CXK90_13010 [Stutzerimonas stutzeri]QQC09360.1 hypothetical protein I6I22_10725 [Stutzerimonas stutzeri]VEI35317.1 Uncharacterised protein [Stutzerimonas stutzeri]